MQMKNIIKVGIGCCLGAVLTSCVKDNNEYTFDDVNLVTVTTTDTVFTVQQLQNLIIKPTLTESLSNTGDTYAYEWSVNTTASLAEDEDEGTENSNPDLLSSEKDLNVRITLSPSKYTLKFTVTNNKTGIKAIKKYDLIVNGAFYEGWFVINNKNNSGQVSFIRKDGEVFMDPIKGLNSVGLNGRVLGAYSAISSQMRQIYVFTDQEAARYSVDDFKLSATDSRLFNEKINFTDPFYCLHSMDQYMINSGKVYATLAPVFGVPGRYSQSFGGLDYEAFPYLFMGDEYYTSIYDNKNKRFVHSGYNTRSFTVFGSMDDARYDLRNVGKTLIAADKGANDEYYILMKDDASDLFYYGYNPSLASPARLTQAIKNSPEIKQTTSIVASGLFQHLYYSSGNKIYLYDILANSSRLLFEFPVGKNIATMAMYKDERWSGDKDPLSNKRLVVATNQSSEGEVFYFDLATTGDIAGKNYVKSFSGFGEIVQLSYRSPNE